MKKRAPLLMLLATLASTASGQTKHTVPINADRDVTTLTVKIGGVTIPNILLDTGFAFDGIMIYNPDLGKELDLKNAIEMKIGGAGSGEGQKALVVESEEIVIADKNLPRQKIIVLQSDIYKGFPSNGLIGYSIFGHYAVEFDYDNNTITLYEPGKFKPDKSWTEIPLYFKDNNIPWINASVVTRNEKPAKLFVYIDLASREAVELLERPGMKFKLPEKTTEAHLGRGLSGDVYGRTGYISKLIIGPYELLDVKTSIAPAKVRSKQDDADAIIGNGAFKRFDFVLDYANKKLYLKPNSHFKEHF